MIWVSTIIFIAIGITIITLILSSANPMISRMSDKNTIFRTKDLLSQLDGAVKEVVEEGPGSQRRIDLVSIEKGELYIEKMPLNYSIRWEMETNTELMELGQEITEGNIHMLLNSTKIVGTNKIILWVESNKVTTNLTTDFTDGSGPFKGKYIFTIKHQGFDPAENRDIIGIEVN